MPRVNEGVMFYRDDHTRHEQRDAPLLGDPAVTHGPALRACRFHVPAPRERAQFLNQTIGNLDCEKPAFFRMPHRLCVHEGFQTGERY